MSAGSTRQLIKTVLEQIEKNGESDYMAEMKYLDYGSNVNRCRHVVMTRRAFAAIFSAILKNGKNETGGVFIGHIYKGIFYIIDSIDQGLVTTNLQEYFQWDADYVNHLVEVLSTIYRFPVTIIGFWHERFWLKTKFLVFF